MSGQGISATRYAVPWMVAGAVLTAVASDLLYTFRTGSPASVWIGYQVSSDNTSPDQATNHLILDPQWYWRRSQLPGTNYAYPSHD